MIQAKTLRIALCSAAALALALPASAQDVKLTPEQETANITAASEVDGKWFTAEDIPTFKIAEDGTVDWYTFSGFRRYNAECSVCHGPDGQGSTYAPALAKSVLRLDYYDVMGIVAGGKQEGNLVMPAFGDNKNVMCYLDDIYVYLKAVGTGAIQRGRPAKRADKPEAYVEQENACMG
ncbi:MAG: c-type cytochrome, methanol metabolism-related [Rhodovulum sulfidophilum]|uniref:C-type cytochrome, methanol metabolism-related n=1 Tax=Rhodovulum sulfidophilum TaxID=35806 RepID=A0A2W5Q2M2_RHOSU|nr:MAG: c-type cytochrome, methanol metabolism-related [Rhodovulum sulfidophilum]